MSSESRKALLDRLTAAGFRFRKSLGQNFLWQEEQLAAITEAAGAVPGAHVFEIGAGAGSLSVHLAKAVGETGRLDCWEIDARLEPLLRDCLAAFPQAEVHLEDARTADYRALMPARGLRLVGNLPYYITTDLILTLLTRVPEAESMCFLLDTAALPRVFAAPGTKAYGPLAAMLALYGEGEKLFRVPAHAFVPQPRTESTVLRFRRRGREGEKGRAMLNQGNSGLFRRFLEGLFRQRRKSLRNALAALLPADGTPDGFLPAFLQTESLSGSVRAEELQPAQLLRLMEALDAGKYI